MPAGLSGPPGGVCQCPRIEIDAQASFYLGKGPTFLFQGLNLNNEVFGIYEGGPHYFIQREC